MNHAVVGKGSQTDTATLQGRDCFRHAASSLASIILGITLLGCFSASAQETDASGLSDSDVERLRGLLLRHRSFAGAPVAPEPSLDEDANTLPFDATPGEAELALLLNAPYSREKLLLRADEWPLLRSEVESRLADSTIAERRSDSPLIGTIQIRQRGSLVGSSTYNLRHIGKHQFVGQTELGDGLNVFGVSDFQREIELPPLERSPKYLLLLTAPPRQDWVLHLIPATVLAEMQSDRPAWLRDPRAEESAAP
ncbi:hypothetical protein [Congregibacter sp.]|uniref:hypothetical protein n=1 Tax=Congregibacter sp. TaxID=2744308 RepID=UPI003F6B2590